MSSPSSLLNPGQSTVEDVRRRQGQADVGGGLFGLLRGLGNVGIDLLATSRPGQRIQAGRRRRKFDEFLNQRLQDPNLSDQQRLQLEGALAGVPASALGGGLTDLQKLLIGDQLTGAREQARDLRRASSAQSQAILEDKLRGIRDPKLAKIAADLAEATRRKVEREALARGVDPETAARAGLFAANQIGENFRRSGGLFSDIQRSQVSGPNADVEGIVRDIRGQ